MTEASVQERSYQNLVSSYLKIAMEFPDSEQIQVGRFVGCRNKMDHPITNFLIGRSEHAGQLVDGDLDFSEHAYLYVVGQEGELPVLENVYEWGNVYNLDCLIFNKPDVLDLAYQTPEPPTSQSQRQAVAQFIVGQFFPSYRMEMRSQIVDGLVACADFEFYGLFQAPFSHIAAALMLFPDADSQTLGIYCLCVEPSRRRRGVGSHLVRFALNEAAKRSLLPVLQCNPLLTSWYQTKGFELVDSVRVFGRKSG